MEFDTNPAVTEKLVQVHYMLKGALWQLGMTTPKETYYLFDDEEELSGLFESDSTDPETLVILATHFCFTNGDEPQGIYHIRNEDGSVHVPFDLYDEPGSMGRRFGFN